MNIKKVVTILIGVMLVSFGVGFLSFNLMKDKQNGKFNIRFNNKNYPISFRGVSIGKNNKNYKTIDEKDNASIAGIENINVEANIAQINIISEDRKDVSIHYHGDISPYINTSLNTKSSGNRLLITADSKNNHGFNLSSTTVNLYLDIIIPTSYANNLNLKTDLGSIKIEGLKLDKLSAKGDLGAINIQNTNVKELKAESSLGKISIEDTSSIKNKLSTDLGAIKTKNTLGSLEAKTNLGSIELEYNEFDFDIDADSDSGSIKIILPKTSNFTLDAHTSMGSIKSNLPLEIQEQSNTKLIGKIGSGKNNISLSVELGSIDIKSK